MRFSAACLAWMLMLFRLVSHGAEAALLSDRQEAVLVGILTDRVTQRWVDLDTNQLVELRRKVDAYMSGCRTQHRAGGLIVSLRSRDQDRVAPVAYEEFEDSATWTGFYLASLAFRYAVTQEPAVVEDIHATLEGVDRLLAVSGRPGYLARFAARTDDPLLKGAFSPRPDGPGRTNSRSGYSGTGGHDGWTWFGDTSRESYSAINLGLTTCFEMLPLQTAIRDKIAGQVSNIVRRIELDRGRIDDGKGHSTFVTPVLRLALMRAAATVNPTVFGPEYEAIAKDPQVLLVLASKGANRFGDYRPATFAMADWMVLARLERNETRKTFFQDRSLQVWRDAVSHLNPWFAAATTASQRAGLLDPGARATLQGVLYQFPEPPRWSQAIDHRKRDDLLFVEANGRKWSKIALPFSFRSSMAFQWTESPFALENGETAPVSHPGIDLFLPYWIARESDMIPAEEDAGRERYDVKSGRSPGGEPKRKTP